MKKYLLAAALFLPIYCAIVVCCTPSLHPLYTDEDVIFDEALIGVWQEEGAKGTWEFTRMEGEDAYRVVYTDDNGVSGELIVHLVLIEDRKFLDFYPADWPEDCEMNAFYGIHFVPAHTFAVVEQIEPKLRLGVMGLDWLGRLLARNPNVIAHEFIGEPGDESQLVFTASTEELQAFMIRYIDTEGAYWSCFVLFRVEEGGEEGCGEEGVESAESEPE
jgi:hypothetical protein